MKTKYLIIIIILLGSFAAYKYFTQTNSTITERKDFAVKDTAAITKVFLAGKNEKQVTLTRLSKSQWKVNGTYKARKDLVKVLLKTICNIEVKSPVAKAARENVIKRLASGATKVEIYTDGEEPNKVYYVGGATQNTMGTYMLLENSSEPFIIHLPYFFGYLTTRYTTDIRQWRDKSVISLEFKDIKKVQIEYPEVSEQSFSITNIGDWSYELKALNTDSIVRDHDSTALKIYLTGFKNIQYEGFEQKITKAAKDSIFNSTPVNIFTCIGINGEEVVMKSYLKPDYEDRVDIDGNPIIYDVDRMYARINNTDELVTIQYYVFDEIFLGLGNFLKPEDKI